MTEIPVPDSNGIYSFESRFWDLHCQTQIYILGEAKKSGLEIEVSRLPLLDYYSARALKALGQFRDCLAIPKPRLSGRPIIALEPHPDDLILSLGGALLCWQRPLHVLTFFSRSRTIHPKLKGMRELNNKEITQLRENEESTALGAIGGTQYGLDHWEANWPLEPPDYSCVDDMVDQIRPILRENPDAELMAPFCFSHHPDHIIVRKVAEKLGCEMFWEDTDFYANYARSTEDVTFGKSIWPEPKTSLYISIDSSILLKFAALSAYASQCFPSPMMYGPVRFNWTVARQGVESGAIRPSATFSERIWVYSS